MDVILGDLIGDGSKMLVVASGGGGVVGSVG